MSSESGVVGPCWPGCFPEGKPGRRSGDLNAVTVAPGVRLNASWSYAVLGLCVRTDRCLPGLEPLAGPQRTDVEIRLGRLPPHTAFSPRKDDTTWYVSPYRDEQGRPTLTVWKRSGGRWFDLTCSDGLRLLVDSSGGAVWSTWPAALSLEDATEALLGLGLGFIHLLRGTTCLHASAVAVQGQAVAFLGPSGAGKSTTAAAFARRGSPVLADDLVALIDRGPLVCVYPANPQLRLWGDSVEFLFGRPDALPLLTPHWDKRKLDLSQEGYRFQGKPLPLGGLYVLRGRCDDSAAPRLETPSVREAMIALVGNTYLNGLLDPPRRAREFSFLSRLLARVPVRFVIPHRDPDRLPILLDLVLRDQHALSLPGPEARFPEPDCSPSGGPT